MLPVGLPLMAEQESLGEVSKPSVSTETE